MDCSPPGPSVHGISQARILEWVVIFYSRGTFPNQGSNPHLSCVSCIGGGLFTTWTPGEASGHLLLLLLLSRFSRVRLCATPWTAAYLCPWNSSGKNTEVGCHFLLQCMKVESESEVAQSCPILCDPMDCSPPGSSIHGIFQATVLEWGAIAYWNPNPSSSSMDEQNRGLRRHLPPGSTAWNWN